MIVPTTKAELLEMLEERIPDNLVLESMDFMLRVGNKTYWGNYLEQVIDKAFEAEGPRK